MNRKAKTVAAAAAAVGAVLGGIVVAPQPADAAGYIAVCGSDYRPGSRRDIPGGTVFLAAKGKSRCAIVVRNTDGPPAVYMSVWLRSGLEEWHADRGNFNQYAGPVYTTVGADGCADYGGKIGNSGTTAHNVCW